MGSRKDCKTSFHFAIDPLNTKPAFRTSTKREKFLVAVSKLDRMYLKKPNYIRVNQA